MFLRHTLLGFLWALFILIVCAIPTADMPESALLSSDKAIHAAIFAFLVLQLNIGFHKQQTFSKLRYKASQIAVVSGILYGILVELMQGTIFAYRSMDVFDMLANTVGCFLGWAIFRLIFGKEKKRPGKYEPLR